MPETVNGVVVPTQGATPANPAAPAAPQISVGLSADAVAAIQAAGRAPAVPANPDPAKPVTPAAPVASFNPNTGDSVIDFTVQNFAKANGISEALYTQAIAPAVQSGDINSLNLAEIAKAGGPEAITAAMNLVKTLSAHNAAKNQSVVDFVHNAAGGAENWKAAAAHFNTAQPDFVKQQYVSLLESGDPQKVTYAVQQIMQQAQAAGVVRQGLPIQPGTGTAGSVQGLSAAEFGKALDELQKKYPNRSFESGPAGKEYAELLARRKVGVQLSR